MINKTLAILAGGKSSRMNYNNKALLTYKEKRFIEHIIEAGKDYKEVIIISNNLEEYKGFNLRIVEDIYKGNGPLSGIHSALINSTTDKVLCIACDMPLITKETLNIIGSYQEEYDVLVPKVSERLQPLCGVYSKNIISKIEEAIKENNNKLQLLIRTLNLKVIEGDINSKFIEQDFLNINTEKEYKELEEL
ncbi:MULTISPECIES: molybdenum cofactor guanylyltransferase [unclassified Clostridium]|uniref:molybdenum cofactor guanylyltransferase n=1 Tax=Clostridium TaxID=1485 RepID=UPI001C8CD927|nr:MULTISPECIES: molybdenum cofactor guanylyltransferase [unclassified Clostridium]MBX9137744.1 molybdenum cofactor guanylyltransferase [Clostridium sp. K12(2020)]MBX9144631.1 molybdenum cofactor guanylyltransferase [Clostridium sp. K13]MDU2289254.1 molybdenum cofactor guanylyltransferase [Clostridium celatum]MDU4326933.1 molybdenum cofactor guanylyltransferase [Clostridium celatum]